MENQLLYGSSYTLNFGDKEYKPNPELRKCIGDAVDEVLKKNYKKAITENVFAESPIMEMLKKNQEERIMDTAVEKALAERKEKRAADILTYLDEVFDELWEDGTTVEWTEVYKDNADKTYRSVAVLSEGYWYRSGVSGRFDDEGLKAVIAEKALKGKVTINETVL